MKICPNCGRELEDNELYCIYCGTKLENSSQKSFCSNCGRALKPYERYCPICGSENKSFDPNAKEEEKPTSQAEYIYRDIDDGIPKYGAFECYKRLFTRAFDFKDRSTRAEYWWPVLFNIVIGIVLDIINLFFPSLIFTFEYETIIGTIYSNVGLFSLIYSVILFIPNLSCIIRRIRDTGRSPLYLFMYFIPIVGPIIVLVFLAQRTDYVWR